MNCDHLEDRHIYWPCTCARKSWCSGERMPGCCPGKLRIYGVSVGQCRCCCVALLRLGATSGGVHNAAGVPRVAVLMWLCSVPHLHTRFWMPQWTFSFPYEMPCYLLSRAIAIVANLLFSMALCLPDVFLTSPPPSHSYGQKPEEIDFPFLLLSQFQPCADLHKRNIP